MTTISSRDIPTDPSSAEEPGHPGSTGHDLPDHQTLFEWPDAERTPGASGSGRTGILRRLDVDRLVAVERAAALASEPSPKTVWVARR